VPTFERSRRFDREFRRMSRELQRAFLAMLPLFIAALRESPPSFLPALRFKRVQVTDGVWEITFAPDGRATFAYGEQVRPGEGSRDLAPHRHARHPLRAITGPSETVSRTVSRTQQF
jgi:hypothetical protein